MPITTPEAELPATASSVPRTIPQSYFLNNGQRSIPSLDGLRAIAVGMVILPHFMAWSTEPKHGILHTFLRIVGQGEVGVNTFFVISGFLITTLLLNEDDRTGGINLSRFYFRRTLRIFPPYYLYLVVASIVAYCGSHPIPTRTLVTAATYVSNYYPYVLSHPDTTGWYVAHTWSLSVEEQFYLFWPLLLTWLPRRLALKSGITILLISPLVRFLTVKLLPVYAPDGQWYRLFHTNIDILMCGCLLAFLIRRPAFGLNIGKLLHPLTLVVSCGYLTFSTFVYDHAPSWFEALFGVSLTSLSITVLLVYVVARPKSLPGRILNLAPIRHLGVISYGLYLWQQLFLGPYRAPSSLQMVLAALLCAEGSYWLLERPILRMRARLEKRISFLQPVLASSKMVESGL